MYKFTEIYRGPKKKLLNETGIAKKKHGKNMMEFFGFIFPKYTQGFDFSIIQSEPIPIFRFLQSPESTTNIFEFLENL